MKRLISCPRGRGRADGVAGSRRRRAPRRPTITLVAHDSFAVSKSVLAAFTKQTGREGEAAPVRRRGPGLEPGDPHQGPSGRRRAVRRRQHVPQPRARRGDLRAVRPCGARDGAPRVPTRLHAPPHADRPRRRVHQLRQAMVREAERCACQRRSTTSRSPRTRASSWSRTRRRRLRGSRSCSRPSLATAKTVGATTGRSSGRTT